MLGPVAPRRCCSVGDSQRPGYLAYGPSRPPFHHGVGHTLEAISAWLDPDSAMVDEIAADLGALTRGGGGFSCETALSCGILRCRR